MEKRRRKKPVIDNTKKLLLAIDGILLLALVAAVVILCVTLGKGGGIGQTLSQGAAASAPQSEPQLDGGDGAMAPAAVSAAPAMAAGGAGVDFTQLKNDSVPVVAYLKGDGTAIDYPVVQNIDNEYYMTRDIYGKKSESGAIYLDSRNTTELVDDQIVIYGNPMQDGTMFGSLVSYSDAAYYEAHPSLTLYTETEKYRIDVFAAHTASPAMSNYPILFLSADERKSYIESARGQSFFQTNLEIGGDDRLVCLVTCADFDAAANACFVVHGVLVKD